MRKRVVAICCSDIHLSLKPPVARSGEEDWLTAQERALDQLGFLADNHQVPILCAGDVFHRWNSSAELINWAIDNLPVRMYSIPGQHDLPFHNHDLIHRSAYWTICKASSKFMDIDPGELWGFNGIGVQAFPWGFPLTPAPDSKRFKIKVALVHRYIWIKGSSYPGAPQEAKCSRMVGDGMGWDAIIFGDNHKGFLRRTKAGTTIFNCGGLQRRNADEVDYHPQVGLLFEDGTIEPHLLDCSADILTVGSAKESSSEAAMDLEDFLEELTRLQGSDLDFEQVMKQALGGTSPAVRRLILEAME